MTHNNLKKSIGNKIKLIRIIREIPLVKLAECLGISRRQLQNYEQGSVDIKLARLYEIAKIMNVSIDFFFDENSCDLHDLCEDDINVLLNYKNIKDPHIKNVLSRLLAHL